VILTIQLVAQVEVPDDTTLDVTELTVKGQALTPVIAFEPFGNTPMVCTDDQMREAGVKMLDYIFDECVVTKEGE